MQHFVINLEGSDDEGCLHLIAIISITSVIRSLVWSVGFHKLQGGSNMTGTDFFF
jgi:hypothetical protein